MSTTTMSSSSSLTTVVAVLASPSRIDDMVAWVTTNMVSLGGCSLLVSPRELAERLMTAQRLALDSRKLSLRLENVDSCYSDVVIAGKILAGEIKGVVLFKDHYASASSTPDLSLLVRACDASNIPLATNTRTADFILRGVSKTRVAYLIFNPVAGKGNSDQDLELIRSILEPTIILHVVFTEKDRDMGDQTKKVVQLIQASKNGNSSLHFIIVASGGDGTVSAVAGATMSSGIPFGVIPRGTANAFSVALGIPTQVDEACRTILTGQVRVIDGGKCNQVPFINLAGVGFEAGLVSNATRELKNVFGNVAYALGGAQQALQQKPFQCEIQIDNEEKRTIQTKVITVANVAPPSSVFAQGFGEIIPDDGFFEATIATGKNAFGELDALATLWASSLVKTAVSSENVLRVRAKTITVNCDPPQKLLLDGEVLEANPVTFQIIPNGLHVVIPVPPENGEK